MKGNTMNSNLRKKRNRDAMAHFNQDELNQIGQWLREGELTLEQIAANCEKQFTKTVTIWTLSRFRRDLCIIEIDEDNEHALEAAADVNHYAVTGEAGVDGNGFHTAALFLIEKQAFELALHMNGKVSKEDHGRFKDLFRMKLAHENSQTKKAGLEIQKQKLELARHKQAHHELVTEQKRVERQNVNHARFGLPPASYEETAALAEKIAVFSSGARPSPAAATPVPQNAPEPPKPQPNPSVPTTANDGADSTQPTAPATRPDISPLQHSPGKIPVQTTIQSPESPVPAPSANTPHPATAGEPLKEAA